ncbi:cell division protein FtsW [Marmoricola endophyticus]|uniref:Probable peptidoglycan glycosyltransferase FtsW n=1 Tax=Marmoricola endophyticus TaxID=2040280 RepID=A0A917F2D0_9ACTN|nr:putative lipid II flippase FtsW [Marmoricola endophyticus]GGF37948.1 cell division protein FtsW [Marmoricola endophyticus]
MSAAQGSSPATAGQRGVAPVAAGLRATLRERVNHPLAPYFVLIGATTLLLGIGLMEVLSASSVLSYRQSGNSYRWFERQAVWMAIGVPTAFLVSKLPVRLIRGLAWPAIGVALVLVALTQSPLGVTVNGNRNWVSFGGPLQIQPAEIAKFALILWCAHIYAMKDRYLDQTRHVLVPVIPVFLVMAGMVVGMGGDLGTGLVLGGIILGMLWVVGAPLRLFAIAASLAGSVALVLAASSPERLSRMTSFIDPFQHFDKEGYQSGHGILGLASGGIFGKGIGASQQKWGSLPEPHTDFIFAVLGEELGLVGTLLVLVLFLGIFWAGIRIASQAQEPFVRYLAAGITIWLAVQTLINIGMVLTLLPVVGIPLPLVSYGGSSLVPELVAIGLLVSFARREPAAASALARRREQSRQDSGRRPAAPARRPSAATGPGPVA